MEAAIAILGLKEHAKQLAKICAQVKNLIRCRPEDETPIRDLTIRRIPRYIVSWLYFDSFYICFVCHNLYKI
jgi:hypothetical protein